MATSKVGPIPILAFFHIKATMERRLPVLKSFLYELLVEVGQLPAHSPDLLRHYASITLPGYGIDFQHISLILIFVENKVNAHHSFAVEHLIDLPGRVFQLLLPAAWDLGRRGLGRFALVFGFKIKEFLVSDHLSDG